MAEQKQRRPFIPAGLYLPADCQRLEEFEWSLDDGTQYVPRPLPPARRRLAKRTAEVEQTKPTPTPAEELTRGQALRRLRRLGAAYDRAVDEYNKRMAALYGRMIEADIA